MVIALLAGVGTVLLAAQQLGNNTVFSQFGNTIPVERLPVVKNFAKSPLQLLSKSIEAESDIEFQKSLNGREVHTGADIDFTGMAKNLEFTATERRRRGIDADNTFKDSEE